MTLGGSCVSKGDPEVEGGGVLGGIIYEGCIFQADLMVFYCRELR